MLFSGHFSEILLDIDKHFCVLICIEIIQNEFAFCILYLFLQDPPHFLICWARRGHILLQKYLQYACYRPRTLTSLDTWTCICSDVENIISWNCHVYGLFEFRKSLGTSILLWMLFIKSSRLLVRIQHLQVLKSPFWWKHFKLLKIALENEIIY